MPPHPSSSDPPRVAAVQHLQAHPRLRLGLPVPGRLGPRLVVHLYKVPLGQGALGG